MAYTVSFHMGSKSNTEHNLRIKANNQDIDSSKTKDNIVLYNQTLEDAYKEVFDDAIREYNSRQKRKDRIKYQDATDYLKEIQRESRDTQRNVKRHSVYECVVQIGDIYEHPDDKKATEILSNYFEQFRKRYGLNIKVVCATIHLDEATPHLHISFIPLARENARGLSVQNSLNRCFEEITNEKSKGMKQFAQMNFQNQQREVLKDICVSRGLELREAKSDIKTNLTVEQYKIKQDNEKLLSLNKTLDKQHIDKQKESDFLDSEITTKRKERDSLTQDIKKLVTEELSLTDKISTKKNTLEKLTHEADEKQKFVSDINSYTRESKKQRDFFANECKKMQSKYNFLANECNEVADIINSNMQKKSFKLTWENEVFQKVINAFIEDYKSRGLLNVARDIYDKYLQEPKRVKTISRDDRDSR